MPASATAVGRVPGSAAMIEGSESHGAAFAAVANFEENSPKVRCWLRSRISPKVGDVPERGRPSVAQDDLVAVGQREEVGEPGAHPTDQVAHRRLPVRGAHQRGPGRGERVEVSGLDLRGPGSEAAVGRQQGGGDLKGVAHRGNLPGW